MKLNFDYYQHLEQVDLFLCNPDGKGLYPLSGKSRRLTLRFNDLSELTFTVDSTTTLLDGNIIEVEAYDYIQSKRLVYATSIGWFQIASVEEYDNGITKYKSIKAESYQVILKNKGFISEEKVYCFYNPNDPYDDRYDSTQEDSIPSVMGQWFKQLGIKQSLGQGLADPATPYNDWTVTYIHPSLTYIGTGSICRTFKESTTFGYEWIVNDVESAFEVVVLFDFMYKTIHVLLPSQVAEKVNVIYTFQNFMKNIHINENSDDIVTVLNCNGNNCDITEVNPTGTNYICDFSYYMDRVNNRWMSPALISKLEDWKSDCDDEKVAYALLIKNLRELYKLATENETMLKEMSLSLADLRTAQNQRMVLGHENPGTLCGIVAAESVKSRRQNINGTETVIGGRSINPNADYYDTDFTGNEIVTAYQFAPMYDEKTRQWDWSAAGENITDTADAIIARNLSDLNTSGKTYWYFADSKDVSSYCKLQSVATVNKTSTTSSYYCGGFNRYIAYTYPVFDAATGKTIYRDMVQLWINLREQLVKDINIDLYGYGFSINGYQYDYTKKVDTKDGSVYVTTGSAGSLLPTDDSIYGRINSQNALMRQTASRYNILSYFSDTPELLRELNCYWIEGDYTNENIAVLDDTMPEEEIDLANELLASGYAELSKVCQPRFSFSIDSVDVTRQYEFRNQMRLLELGKVITIEKEEGVWYYPALLEISMSLDNSDDFTMSFANAMKLNDWGYTYADLISDASSTSRQVSANWQNILAYSKERENINSIIKDPLDSTLRAAFSNMVNQEFVVDKNGILGRKKVSNTSDDFEDEQVRLINNLLVFTDDNWQTAKTALGKIYYTDENQNPVSSYGLIAETIIGSLIMGEKLKIQNQQSTIVLGSEGITIKQSDGTVVFSAGVDGTLLVNNYATKDSVASAIELAERGINAYATSSGGSDATFGWSLKSDGFYLKSNSNTVMQVTSAGLEVAGKITSDEGSIAGWVIGLDNTVGAVVLDPENLGKYILEPMHIIRSPYGKYGSISYTTTGADVVNKTGWIFSALTPYGLAYIVKDGADYVNSATIEIRSVEDCTCSFEPNSGEIYGIIQLN